MTSTVFAAAPRFAIDICLMTRDVEAEGAATMSVVVADEIAVRDEPPAAVVELTSAQCATTSSASDVDVVSWSLCVVSDSRII
jgi:hypothetical protein